MTAIAHAVLPAIGGAVIGAAVGWFGAALIPTSVREPPIAAQDAPLTASADPGGPACEALVASTQELAAEASRLRREAGLRRGQLALIGGVPNPWPEGFDHTAHEASLNAAVAARLRERHPEVAGRVEARVHCDEDPCILWLRVGQDPQDPRPTVRFDHDLPTLIDERPAYSRFIDNTDASYEVLWTEAGLPAAAARRARVRVDRLVEEALP
jgi:hypothetical protein